MFKPVRLMTLIAASAMILAGCGGSESGDGDGGGASGGLALDRAFAAEMIPHHKSAVEMATIAQERGESAFVRRLAENILTSQSAEIKTLEAAEARLAEAGTEMGSLGLPDHAMGMDGDVESLRTAEPFDKAFLEMMIPHHESAVEMAKIEIAKGSDPDLKALAEEILAAQSEEITQMREHLGEDAPPTAGHG